MNYGWRMRTRRAKLISACYLELQEEEEEEEEEEEVKESEVNVCLW